jgi:hypothetical protein
MGGDCGAGERGKERRCLRSQYGDMIFYHVEASHWNIVK